MHEIIKTTSFMSPSTSTVDSFSLSPSLRSAQNFMILLPLRLSRHLRKIFIGQNEKVFHKISFRLILFLGKENDEARRRRTRNDAVRGMEKTVCSLKNIKTIEQDAELAIYLGDWLREGKTVMS
jgi:hypothetical protein